MTIEVNGKSIAIPAALRRLIPAETKWRNFGGKVYSLPLHSEDKVRMSLMYINQAVSVPQHTHKGIESTLVLHGGFSDEEGHYEVGILSNVMLLFVMHHKPMQVKIAYV